MDILGFVGRRLTGSVGALLLIGLLWSILSGWGFLEARTLGQRSQLLTDELAFVSKVMQTPEAGPAEAKVLEPLAQEVRIQPKGQASQPQQKRSGKYLRGVLKNAQGEPIRGEVQLHFRDSVGAWKFRARRWANQEGAFAFPVTVTGAYRLYAKGLAASVERGKAATELKLDTRSSISPIELVLQGGGVLRGRVLNSSGRPTTGIELVMERTGLPREKSARPTEGTESSRATGVNWRGWRGRRDAETVTVVVGPDGRFEVQGLLLGSYRVSARKPNSKDKRLALLAQHVVADGTPLSLQFDRPHIAVKCTAPGGAPFQSHLYPDSRKHFLSSDYKLWPATLRLFCMPLRTSASGQLYADYSDQFEAGHRAGEGVFEYEIQPNRTYAVGLWGGHLAPEVRTVFVPADADRVELDWVIHSQPAQRGELEMQFGFANPKATFGLLKIQIREPLYGIPLMGLRKFVGTPDFDIGDHEPVTLKLPHGEYSLSVEGAGDIGTCGMMLYENSPCAKAQREIAISSSKTQLDFELPQGALLKLELKGFLTEAQLGKNAGSGSALYFSGAEATLRLIDSDGLPIAVDSVVDRGTHLLPSYTWSLGQTRYSEPLPAGNFRLEARLPDGRVTSIPVTLKDGETTRAVLSF